MFEPWHYLAIAGLGLAAGLLGGMLGVGGSVIMIPGLVVLFGQGTREGFEGFNQHVYQASAMVVTVLVSAPAAWRHYRKGAAVPRALRLILPWALAATLAGVWVSNLSIFEDGIGETSGPVMLGRVMAVFLVYVIVENVRKMFRPARPVDAPVDLTYVTPVRSSVVGGGMGLVAGLTGLGGGAVAVPLQQVLLKLRLRNCIANSSAMICLTGVVGSIYKHATLGNHGLNASTGFILAGLLAPTAVLGGYLGAGLTHILPVRLVRAVFILLMVVATWKMAAV